MAFLRACLLRLSPIGDSLISELAAAVSDALAIDCRACSAAVSAGSITSLTTYLKKELKYPAIHGLFQ